MSPNSNPLDLRPHKMGALSVALVLGLGCATKDPPRKTLETGEASSESVVFLGVAASDFRCESVAPLAEIRAIVGANARLVQSAFEPPAGVPAPCNYVVHGDPPVQWSVDLDCRDGALDDGAKLIATYASQAGANPVRVGQSGLDHNNMSLIFIDDDAPCYGRVLGPMAPERLAIARLVAEGLTEKTAPTGARIATP